MTWIVAAEIHLASFDDKPPGSLALSRIAEAEVHDHSSIRWEQFAPRKPAHVPHQKTGIELIAFEAAANPTRAPVTERHDDRTQLFARCRQAILGVARRARHDADFLQLAQSLRQQRCRDSRHAAT